MFLIFVPLLLAIEARSHLICNPSIYGCLECDDSNRCISCDENLFLVSDQAGNCECTFGYYPEVVTGSDEIRCLPCEDVLPNCFDCAVSTECSICSPPFVVDNTTFQCGCPSSFYYNEESNSCDRCCLAGCLECSSSEVCEICDDTNNFQLATNQCECKPGFYLQLTISSFLVRRLDTRNDITYECLPCTIDKCSECFSPTLCTVCESSFVLNDLRNECVCPSQYTQIGDSCEFLPTLYSDANFTSCYTDYTATYRLDYDYDINQALCEPFTDSKLRTLFSVSLSCQIDSRSIILRLFYLLPLDSQIQYLSLLRYYQPPIPFSYQNVLRDLDQQYALEDPKLEITGPDVFYSACPDASFSLTVDLFDGICSDEEDYTWSVAGENVDDLISSTVSSQSGLTIDIPINLVPTGVYYFSVSVTTLFQVTFFDIKKVEIVPQEIEVLLTTEPNFIKINNSLLQTQAFTNQDLCEGFDTDFHWSAEFDWDGTTNYEEYAEVYDPDILEKYEDVIVYDSSYLQIFPGTLPVGGPYIFTVTATEALAKGTTSVRINVISGPKF